MVLGPQLQARPAIYRFTHKIGMLQSLAQKIVDESIDSSRNVGQFYHPVIKRGNRKSPINAIMEVLIGNSSKKDNFLLPCLITRR